MGPEPLDYASRRYWRLGRDQLIALCIILVVPGLILAGLMVDVRQTRGRVDTITGTTEWQTTWFGVKGRRVVEVSPLELRLKKSGIPWTPTWRFLANTHYTLFGNVTCFECGLTPPIYQLRGADQEFVDASTDKELRRFVKVMQSGTPAEQRAAVQAATEKDWQTSSKN